MSSVPRFAPSSRNWTPATPTASLAFAETVTDEPETVAPFAGAVNETVGGVMSGTVAVQSAAHVAAVSPALQTPSKHETLT